MTKDHLLKILYDIRQFKQKTGIKIVDTHIHPHDVMGVAHYSESRKINNTKDFLKPGLLELLNYGSAEKIGSKIFFTFFKSTVDTMIHESYDSVNEEAIDQEMQVALVDQSVLLSLDPWTPTQLVGEKYKNKDNFYMLASADIHKDTVEKIESNLLRYIQEYKIKGIKLHPNLQAFKPQPKDNSPEIAAKLRKIYEIASNQGLYILFHGGISNYTEIIHEKYGFYPRNRTNGVLENFCDSAGRSELFETYTMPIVIAHIGHYGKILHNYDLLKTISEKYSHIFFDTSGVSPSFLARSLAIIPSNRIIFGSDAVYNRMAYNLAFLYEAARTTHSSEKFEDILINIMSKNFYERLIKYH